MQLGVEILSFLNACGVIFFPKGPYKIVFRFFR